MTTKLLKILWALIIFLFISLQIYNLIRANYADVVTSLLTVIILSLMIVSYGLIAGMIKSKKIKKEEDEEK